MAIQNTYANVKEGDDWLVNIDMSSETQPLSGWSDLSCVVCPESVTTQDITAGTIDANITVNSDYITVEVPKANTDNLVADGKPSITYYSDVVGTDPNSYYRTFRTIKWNIKRKWRKS